MNGLITIQSSFSVKETIDRLAEIAESKGMTVFARIDHADNALKNGLQLRSTELIIFGNPKAGTFLMQENQTAGIDLPMKVLAWKDEQEKVWLAYNDIRWIAGRHNLAENDSILQAIEEGMKLVNNETANK